jgi:DNA-directed RNA polymerase subunit K/omega
MEELNILSPYDKTSLLGARLSQLSHGAPTLLSHDELKSCKSIKEIAMMELNTRKIPLMVRKVLPDNRVVYVKINEHTVILQA